MTDKRKLIWKHNSFLGHCKLGQKNMQAIIRSETATSESKALAYDANHFLERLAKSLKTRKPL